MMSASSYDESSFELLPTFSKYNVVFKSQEKPDFLQRTPAIKTELKFKPTELKLQGTFI